MSARSVDTREIYRRLLDAYGPQEWWPATSPQEVCLGAVLTQNTAWTNVERALERLSTQGLLHDLEAVARHPREELMELIRPAGFVTRKAPTLQRLAAFLVEECEGDPRQLRSLGASRARRRLLEIHGIGPETADAILLYAAELPVFVADAYSERVARRHGLLDGEKGYEATQRAFEVGFPQEAPLRNEYHALLVRVGKERCRRSVALCEGCPLEPLLPEGGVHQL